MSARTLRHLGTPRPYFAWFDALRGSAGGVPRPIVVPVPNVGPVPSAMPWALWLSACRAECSDIWERPTRPADPRNLRTSESPNHKTSEPQSCGTPERRNHGTAEPDPQTHGTRVRRGRARAVGQWSCGSPWSPVPTRARVCCAAWRSGGRVVRRPSRPARGGFGAAL